MDYLSRYPVAVVKYLEHLVFERKLEVCIGRFTCGTELIMAKFGFLCLLCSLFNAN